MLCRAADYGRAEVPVRVKVTARMPSAGILLTDLNLSVWMRVTQRATARQRQRRKLSDYVSRFRFRCNGTGNTIKGGIATVTPVVSLVRVASGFRRRPSRTSTTGIVPICWTDMERIQQFGTTLGLSASSDWREILVQAAPATSPYSPQYAAPHPWWAISPPIFAPAHPRNRHRRAAVRGSTGSMLRVANTKRKRCHKKERDRPLLKPVPPEGSPSLS